MARQRPGRALKTFGVLAIIVGLVAAVALAVAAVQRQTNAVNGLARAPVGCDTTLDFAEAGEYTVFIERAGAIESVSGDCDAPSRYLVGADLDVDITVVDPSGNSVELNRALDTVSYDIDGFVGDARFVLDIDTPGDHVMRVESNDGPFAVAVGRDPSSGVPALVGAALLFFVGGLLAGIALILIGRRASTSVATPPSFATPPPFAPVGQPPVGPPTYTQPGGPVTYGQQPPQRYGPAPGRAPQPSPYGQPAPVPPPMVPGQPPMSPGAPPASPAPQPSWSPTPSTPAPTPTPPPYVAPTPSPNPAFATDSDEMTVRREDFGIGSPDGETPPPVVPPLPQPPGSEPPRPELGDVPPPG